MPRVQCHDPAPPGGRGQHRSRRAKPPREPARWARQQHASRLLYLIRPPSGGRGLRVQGLVGRIKRWARQQHASLIIPCRHRPTVGEAAWEQSPAPPGPQGTRGPRRCRGRTPAAAARCPLRQSPPRAATNGSPRCLPAKDSRVTHVSIPVRIAESPMCPSRYGNHHKNAATACTGGGGEIFSRRARRRGLEERSSVLCCETTGQNMQLDRNHNEYCGGINNWLKSNGARDRQRVKIEGNRDGMDNWSKPCGPRRAGRACIATG